MAALPGVPHERRVACILGVPIDIVNMDEAVRRVRHSARARAPLFLSTPNLNFAILAQQDVAFRDSLLHSDLCIADGMPLLWVARLLGAPLPERVAGSALLEQLRRGPTDDPIKVYLFGGPDGIAEAAARRLNEERRGLQCVGWESPGMGSAEALSRPESIQRIAASGADFLVVSLGAKKGQEWIVRNRAKLGVPVVSHLGAAPNFIAGAVARAPAWVQRAGLEWLWRIKEEPALWRRYLRDGASFLRLMTTRVLPLAWSMRGRAAADGSALQVVEREDEIVVRLDPAQAAALDMEVVGRLVLLYGRAKRAGRRLRIEGATERLWRDLERAGAGYLRAHDPHGGEGGSGGITETGVARAPR
jgi:N-acetylglucosaminyldiphosphoundecaprenol N-acetyl-beta-D-mannosaminyltransferase